MTLVTSAYYLVLRKSRTRLRIWGAKKGFIKGEALGLLRTYSSQITFEKKISKISKIALIERGYLAATVRKYLSEVKFADKKTAPQQRNKSTRKKKYYLLLHNTTQLNLA